MLNFDGRLEFLTRLVQLFSEGKLNWWHSLAYFVIALFIGIIIANYLFRDVSWYHLFTSKSSVSWTTKGTMQHTGFERYVATIFFTTLFVWGILLFGTHCSCSTHVPPPEKTVSSDQTAPK